MNIEIRRRVIVIGKFISLVNRGFLGLRLFLDVAVLVEGVVATVADASLLAGDDGEREGGDEGHGLAGSHGLDVRYETVLRHAVFRTRFVVF